jgi:hypoxanthine phosphoribosyltransferase
VEVEGLSEESEHRACHLLCTARTKVHHSKLRAIFYPVVASAKLSRMHGDIDRVLISQEQIASRIAEMAKQIVADHVPGGEVTIVPVMTGAMIFTSDLIRQIPIAMQIGLLTVSSYPGSSVSSQGSQLIGQQLGDVAGRHLLLVDDILDSGGTIRLVSGLLRGLSPASVRTCVLLRKDRPAAQDVHADYVGFEIPDEFVVGYGLDYNNYYRNLPDIVTLKPDAIARHASPASK